MARTIIDDLIDSQKGWLDPFASAAAKSIGQARESLGETGHKGFDFLHGVWLGHPLHAVLTDVPVGAWTVAAMLDAVDTFSPNDGVKRCADGALGIGVLGGLGAATAGLADWHHLSGRDRRVGVVHGLLNVIVSSLYGLAWFLRRGKRRGAGVSVSMLAYGIVGLSAYIGGELVYTRGIGVNHTAFQRPSTKFRPVLAEAELMENQPHKAEFDGVPVVLVKQGPRIHALSHTCTHLGGPLAEGKVEDGCIRCPWHGSLFALEDGKVVEGPASADAIAFDARVNEGQVEIRRRA